MSLASKKQKYYTCSGMNEKPLACKGISFLIRQGLKWSLVTDPVFSLRELRLI